MRDLEKLENKQRKRDELNILHPMTNLSLPQITFFQKKV